jgi:hypothetical protein
MTFYHADQVAVVADVEYGEGYIQFRWPDPIVGHEGLKIDLDGHCSREMPIHSGDGPPKFIELDRSGLKLWFPPELAKKLKLDQDLELTFTLTDNDYLALQRVIDHFRELEIELQSN